MVNFLLKRCPMQPLNEDMPYKIFPTNNNGRSFQPSWYWKKLPGNLQVSRDWLSYSIINNKLYCHSCILFGKNRKKTWTKEGFNHWHKAIYIMELHEISEAHIEATLKLKLRLRSMPIIPLMEEKRHQEKALNRKIVRCLINIVQYLAENCISFRGHRENWKNEINQGNFLNLVRVISNYSPVLASYVTQLKSSTKKLEVNFLSKLRQNQIVSSIFLTINSTIKKELNLTKFFSVYIYICIYVKILHLICPERSKYHSFSGMLQKMELYVNVS